jgi:putative PIN family toxin of toxin-antitoxin system
MKVLIDTNILISAAMSDAGVPYRAFLKAVSSPNQGVITDQNLEELHRVFNRKFPQKLDVLNTFLTMALPSLELIKTPTDERESESEIRDIDDRPILRAALEAGVDVILTGDKDFIESSITSPVVMTAADFVSE